MTRNIIYSVLESSCEPPITTSNSSLQIQRIFCVQLLCVGTFADSVSFATRLCFHEEQTIHQKDYIGTLETPVVLSKNTQIRTNGACQIILLFYIVLY